MVNFMADFLGHRDSTASKDEVQRELSEVLWVLMTVIDK
eukprot:gene2340-2648_t